MRITASDRDPGAGDLDDLSRISGQEQSLPTLDPLNLQLYTLIDLKFGGQLLYLVRLPHMIQ